MEDIKECFADDSGKENYRFWDNFDGKININVWEKDCPKIYNYSKSYDSLPDPDVNSRSLYVALKRFWNSQYRRFGKEMTNLNDIDYGKSKCELAVKDEEIVLGSDSIMSIYWHRTTGKMPKVMEKIKECIEDAEKHEKYCSEIKERDYKTFIRSYLEQANTIGGFMIFPRHYCSINQMRGMSDKIQDRFDLTLECIRRAYKNNDFNNLFCGNPLFDSFGCDAKFFRMFGSFENYIKFFCLEDWVNENCTAVYDLLSENGAKELIEWPEEILPCDYKDEEEQIIKWWTFYKNIMSRLSKRNQRIKAQMY